MALVNPNIAMSFRPTVEYQPRNALAEYAQLQSIVGGQRQAEVADLQLEDLRRERDILGQIQAAIVAKGGPPDLSAAADAMIKSGRPEYLQQGLRIRETLAQQQRLEAYEREHYPTDAATSSAVPPTPAPGAATVPTSAPETIFTAPTKDERTRQFGASVDVQQDITYRQNVYRNQMEDAQKLRATNPQQAQFLEDQAARTLAALTEDYGIGLKPTAAPAAAVPAATNALAPAAAPATTNAMRAAAQPDVDALMRRYNQAARANSPDAPAILKQIEAALRGDQNRPVTVSPGQTVIDPRTGATIFTAPTSVALSDRFVPVGRLVFDRQTQQYISPTQAQLAQSQERATTAAAPAARAPLGYRFTPTGDLEPIPGGPAARAAEGAGAAQPKPLTAAQEAARRDKLGKEFKSATAALQTTQDVLDSISFVRAEPGLSRATGFTGTFLPSFPEGAAASAETRLRNLEGKVTALGKAQAAATGAIGSIANQEWQILRDQIAAIDRTKGTGPLLKQLELVELQAQGAMARIRDAYQRQFGEDFERFPQFSELPAPQSSFRASAPGAAPAAAAPAPAPAPATQQGTGGFRYLGKEGK